VQVVALVVDQLRVEALPLATLPGLALRLTVGSGGVTVTVVVWLADPAAPVQVNVKDAVLARTPVLWLPLTALFPDQLPEAVHSVASVEFQVRFAAFPATTETGAASSETVNAGGLPPLPPPQAVRVAETQMISARRKAMADSVDDRPTR
jgi:hypothetical protein